MLVGTPEAKKPFGRSRRKRELNFNVWPKGVGPRGGLLWTRKWIIWASVTFSRRRVLRGVSSYNEAFAGDQQLQCGIGVRCLTTSAVDVVAVVFTRRAVNRPIPDRMGDRVHSQMVLHVLPRVRVEPLITWIHIACRWSFVSIFFLFGKNEKLHGLFSWGGQ
jgi:hypothetical protein